MVILVDADGVLENLTVEMLALINERHGTGVTIEDIKEWDLTKAFPGLTWEQVYGTEFEEELYPRLRPMEGAPEYVKRLMDEGHEVFVVTNTPYQAICYKMEIVMKKYFPFLEWKNFIIASRKQMIKGDVLIDDGIHNLRGGDFAKLLFSAPYNEQYDAKAEGVIRVRNWAEIYSVICELNEK